jgi:hypothetical protein
VVNAPSKQCLRECDVAAAADVGGGGGGGEEEEEEEEEEEMRRQRRRRRRRRRAAAGAEFSKVCHIVSLFRVGAADTNSQKYSI